MRRAIRNNCGLLFLSLLVALTIRTGLASASDKASPQGPQHMEASPMIAEEAIDVSVPARPYTIARTAQGQEVSLEGFGRLLIPGKPTLPSRIFAVAIPPGAEVVDVTFDTGKGIVLPGVYEIPPAPLPRVIAQEDPRIYAARLQRYSENFKAVYGSDDAYPENVVALVRSAGYRKYNLADVRITPFTYRPLSGELTYYPDITVHVNYSFLEKRSAVLVDNLARTERLANEIIINHDQAQTWYPQDRSLNRGLHDFVIITLDSLVASVTPLVDWETAKGRNVEVVTTTWIDANYNGGYDLASDMRAFLRAKYPSGEWGIEDVLLVGHYDDVPMRRTEQDLGYGKPETDFYFAELSLPDDQSWDDDGDHLYGEDSDSVDYYGEVNVGRIPYSSASTVLSICNKSVAYEQNENPAFKKNILLLGAYFWADTDNAELMEAKVDQTWMSDWTMTRMYEQGYSTFAMDYNLTYTNVRTVWSSGTYAFVNWAGHGSPTSSHIMYSTGEAFVSNSTCSYLNDDYPAIIFADACSNHDTDYDNLGWAMMGQGGVGYVGSTKVALGCPGWNDPYDGSSQSMDYFFTTYVTSGDYTQGQAHQRALTDMYTYGLWSYLKYETFEWGALLGNPNLGMASVTPPILTVNLPDGAPDLLAPGVATSFNVEIIDGTETYVPGSGLLHYRYDGGTFLTSALAPLGGDLYEATLPAAACDDTPEFYISAEGNLGTVVFAPVDAPGTVYTAVVGTITSIMDDNFETDQGWTAENLGATSGDWQRGIPVDDSGWDYDPHSDSDGSGQCFLTQNVVGNTDVDDGAVRLTSPTIDMSDGGITISYDYFLRLTDTAGGVDRLLVEIDGNDGAGPWTEIARHDTDGGLSWRHHEIDQADLDAAAVTLTATMKLRFDTNDADPQSINESGLDAFLITGLSCEDTATCEDGFLNQGEDRIDCGGPCPPCECTSDAACDDTVFCNGDETCDAFGQCQAGGGDPCAVDEWCYETGGTCVLYGDGDFEPNGSIDLADFAAFQGCFGELGLGACQAGNITGSGSIDLDDYAAFESAMTGP